jgi:hypothetical protein
MISSACSTFVGSSLISTLRLWSRTVIVTLLPRRACIYSLRTLERAGITADAEITSTICSAITPASVDLGDAACLTLQQLPLVRLLVGAKLHESGSPCQSSAIAIARNAVRQH